MNSCTHNHSCSLSEPSLTKVLHVPSHRKHSECRLEMPQELVSLTVATITKHRADVRNAATDTQPGTSQPAGPSRNQPMTNKQQQFAQEYVDVYYAEFKFANMHVAGRNSSLTSLNVASELPADASKGEASDVISDRLSSNSGSGQQGTGAAQDTNPGEFLCKKRVLLPRPEAHLTLQVPRSHAVHPHSKMPRTISKQLHRIRGLRQKY